MITRLWWNKTKTLKWETFHNNWMAPDNWYLFKDFTILKIVLARGKFAPEDQSLEAQIGCGCWNSCSGKPPSWSPSTTSPKISAKTRTAGGSLQHRKPWYSKWRLSGTEVSWRFLPESNLQQQRSQLIRIFSRLVNLETQMRRWGPIPDNRAILC